MAAEPKRTAKKAIGVFLLITFVMSGICYFIRNRGRGRGVGHD